MKLFTHVILAVCFFGGSSCLGMEVDPTVAGTAPAPTPLPVPPVVGPYMRTMKILTEATGKGQADLIRKQLNEKGEAIFNAFETALSSGESYTARDISHSLFTGKLERYTPGIPYGTLDWERISTLQGNNRNRSYFAEAAPAHNAARDILVSALEKPVLSGGSEKIEASDIAETDNAMLMLEKKKDPSHKREQYLTKGLGILNAAGINLASEDLEPAGRLLVAECGFLAEHGKTFTAQDIMHSLHKGKLAKYETTARYKPTIPTLKGLDKKKDPEFEERYQELANAFTKALTPPPTQPDKSDKKPTGTIPAETQTDPALPVAVPKPPRSVLTLDLKVVNESIPAALPFDPNGLPTAAPASSMNKTRAAGILVAALGALWTLKKFRRQERGYVRKFLRRLTSQKYRDELSRSHTEHSMELSLIDSNGHEALAAASTTLLGIVLAGYGHYK